MTETKQGREGHDIAPIRHRKGLYWAAILRHIEGCCDQFAVMHMERKPQSAIAAADPQSKPVVGSYRGVAE
jgi:hypothetical protein